jgi:hypothetical protein
MTPFIWRHYKGGLYWLMCRATWFDGIPTDMGGEFRFVIHGQWHEPPAPQVFTYLVANGERRGTFYATVLPGERARITLASGTEVMVYQDVATGKVYVRPVKEWYEQVEVDKPMHGAFPSSAHPDKWIVQRFVPQMVVSV